MNDRALRDIVIGLGGVANGTVREDRYVIIPASEVMAIVALSTSRADLAGTDAHRHQAHCLHDACRPLL
jgi:formyltetrahydrofolate synthetase